jgi:hypothetical protein
VVQKAAASNSEADPEVVTGLNIEVDLTVDPSDSIVTERKTETKLNYASTEGSPREKFSPSSLSEQRKKSSARGKKEDETIGVTPHWHTMRKLWMNFYRVRHNGIEPTFTGEAGKALKSILRRLQMHSANALGATSEAWTEKYAAEVFTKFLTLAYTDDWLSKNFRMSVLSSQYDTIIQINPYEQKQSGKSGRKSNATNVNSEHKRRIYEELLGSACEG